MRLLVILVVVASAYLIAQMLATGYFSNMAKKLLKVSYAGVTEHGNKSKPALRVFLAGDSIAAGVGASSPESSMAGRLADGLAKSHHVLFNNSAVSGSRMADMTKLPAERQNLVVLVISSNDLYRFTPLKKFERETQKALAAYSNLSKETIIAGPGNIGGATAVPLIMRPFYNLQKPKYAAILKRVSSSYPNVSYVNPADFNIKSYGRTEAADGFHPNDNGHRFWADLIIDKINGT